MRLELEEDAFGQALLAHYKGKECLEVIERDDGYIEVMAASSYFTSYDEWPQHEKEALKHAYRRILDVGCGAGRHSLYLQEKGFDVMGIDISPLAIEICKLKGLKKARVMSIDKVEFGPDSFDTILMMWNNFGLFSARATEKISQYNF
jgi:2-polyprenyl-3-methyl-5-hydroxy-6-metoxy-1,4-benzoquinol methylase